MIEDQLGRCVASWYPGATGVTGVAKLSGGASQETWTFDIVGIFKAADFLDVSEADLQAAALADEKVRSFVDGHEVVKVVVVPRRLVNIVVR